MGFLGFLLRLVYIGRAGNILGPELRGNEFADFSQGIVGNTHRIRTHISDEADQAFVAEFHAFVQALGDHHDALHAEAQLAGAILLQLGGGEGRSRRAAALPFLHRPYRPVRALQGGNDFLGFFPIWYFDLFFSDADEARIEGGRLGGGKVGVDGPVFFRLKGFDLRLALHNHAQRHGLNPAGGKATAHFVPEQGGNLISDEAVEHAAGLLRVDQIAINVPGVLERLLDGALGDLVKGDAADAVAVASLFLAADRAVAEFFREVGSDGFAFAVRVRSQINVVRGLGQLLQPGQDFFLARDDDVLSLEILVDFHAQLALGQILDVAERGFDLVALAQIFLNRLGLGGRLDDD